jgi:hypothetical protein
MANIEQRLNALEGDVSQLEGTFASQLSDLQAGLDRNNNSWQMWLPSIQQALDKANAAQENLQKIQMDWPMRCVVGADNSITFQHEDLNFTVKAASTTTVEVTQGTWERNGYPLAMAVDSGKTYKTLTVSSDGTYYVYLQLASATYDPSLHPQTLTVEISQTIPDNTTTLNIYKTLCTITVSGGVIAANGITPQYYGGDYRDFFAIPDSNSAYDASSDKRFYSLELSPRGSRHEGTLQDYDWDNAVSTAMTDADFLIFRKTVGTGANQYFEKKYCDFNDFKAADSFLSDYATNAGHAVTADTATDVIHHLHDHSEHVWSTDDHNQSRQPYLLLDANGSATRNLCHASMVIGDNNNKTSISPHGRGLYDAAAKQSVDWNTRTLFDSGGSTAVLCWDTLNGTPKNWKLDFGLTTGNWWKPTGFAVYSTGSAYFNAVGNVGMDSSAGTFSLNSGSSSPSILRSPNIRILPVTEAVGNCYIGNEGGSPNIRFANVRIDATRIDLAIDSATMDIYYAGVLGRSITGWTDKGGLTGTGIIEINQGDLRTTDKILVRR